MQLGWQPANTRVEFEWVHMGNYPLNPENSWAYEGYNLFNLRLSETLDDDWEIFLRVMNMTDRDYAERADVTAAGAIQPRYFVGTPRAFFLGFEWQYD